MSGEQPAEKYKPTNEPDLRQEESNSLPENTKDNNETITEIAAQLKKRLTSSETDKEPEAIKVFNRTFYESAYKSSFSEQEQELFRLLFVNLARKYHIHPYHDSSKVDESLQNERHVGFIVDKIIGLFKDVKNKIVPELGGWKHLQNARILDLGCGSNDTLDSREDENNLMNTIKTSRSYEPWIPRILYELGAHPVGVDVNPNNDEEFENYQLDLREPNALSIFPDKSFDYIQMDNVSGSPTFTKLVLKDLSIVPQGFEKGGKWITDRIHPADVGEVRDKAYKPEAAMKKNVKEQASRLVKDTGKIGVIY